MFVPCIIRCSRNNQHNVQICTTALFIFNHDIQTHRPLNHIIWKTTLSVCIFTYLKRIQKLPEDGRLLPKHVGANIFE
jgi:hypothetical protein